MNPEIKVTSEENDTLSFTLSGVNVSLANALRRTIINDVPILCFRTETYKDNQCSIEKNTTRFHNEIIKQRLSCIPIHSTNFDKFVGNYVLELDEKNDTDALQYITTEHFKVRNKATNGYLSRKEVSELFPPNKITGDFILFVRLRPKIGDIPGEEIKLTCEFSVSNCANSSMYNVVSKCAYGNTIDIGKANEAWTKISESLATEGLTVEDIEFKKKNFYLLDAQRYYKPDSYDFLVKSVGVYTNNQIVKTACRILENRLHKLLEEVKSKTVPIVDVNDEDTPVSRGMSVNMAMDRTYDIILENDDFTIGKMVEYYLYDKGYLDKHKRVFDFCGYKKFHPHDAHSIIRVTFAENVEQTEERSILEYLLENACKELEEYTKQVGKHF